MIADYRAWAARQDFAPLEKAPVGGQDRRPPERLDWITGHTIQHLRQLYWMHGRIGVRSTSPLPDSAFPPEYILPIVSESGGLF